MDPTHLNEHTASHAFVIFCIIQTKANIREKLSIKCNKGNNSFSDKWSGTRILRQRIIINSIVNSVNRYPDDLAYISTADTINIAHLVILVIICARYTPKTYSVVYIIQQTQEIIYEQSEKRTGGHYGSSKHHTKRRSVNKECVLNFFTF